MTRLSTKRTGLLMVLGAIAASYGENIASAAISGFVSAPTGTTRTDALPQEGFGFYGTSVGSGQLNELGYYVAPSDSGGLGVTAVDHTVALYHYNGTNYTDVVQATVPAGSAPDASGYAWVSVPAYLLNDSSQNADYYILTGSSGTDVWTSGGVAVNDTTFGSETNRGWFSEVAAFPGVGNTIGTSALPDPNTLNNDNAGPNGPYGGPNIGFAAAAVPEPASAAIIGIATLGLLLRRRHQIA